MAWYSKSAQSYRSIDRDRGLWRQLARYGSQSFIETRDWAFWIGGLDDRIQCVSCYRPILMRSNVSNADDQNSDMVRIDPDDLPPRDPMDENKGIQIKKIDTILTLKLPTTRVYKAFAKWPAASRSFIQSTMDPHCGTPIVVNIEVKAANGIDPLGQLGIWSAAGFQKRLIDKNEKKGIPCIPMSGLAIVGDRWELHIAYRHPDGRVVGFFFPPWISVVSFFVCPGPLHPTLFLAYWNPSDSLHCLSSIFTLYLRLYSTSWLIFFYLDSRRSHERRQHKILRRNLSNYQLPQDSHGLGTEWIQYLAGGRGMEALRTGTELKRAISGANRGWVQGRWR